jgi:hypothetical protein
MNIDTIKVELIDWIAQLNDHHTINKLLSLKNKLSIQKNESNSKIYGSGKHLIDFVAEDFNEPLDMFKTYQK